MSLRSILSALTALIAASAVLLQADLFVARMTAEGAPVGDALWRLIGYFTIISNTALAIVCGALALPSTRRMVGPRTLLAMATAILLVGIGYSVALRDVWNPPGLQAVADHALHDVTPLLFLAIWILSPHGALTWRDALGAIAAPVAFCLYALARGAFDGWYPYWFIDARSLSAWQVAGNIVWLLIFTALIALSLIAGDRMLARRAAKPAH
ncbi:MAG: Pr6Pr family membrane protein [Pseudomonadota bacterium]